MPRYTALILALLPFALSTLSAQTIMKKFENKYETRITLSRNAEACAPFCPEYSVAINGDGDVIYDGVKSVHRKGRLVYSIPKDQVQKLIAEFQKLDYFALKDRYALDGKGLEVEFSHYYLVTTSLALDGRTKTIKDYYGGPKQLRQLEDLIDEISLASKYVKGE